jgi:hypothetical protein
MSQPRVRGLVALTIGVLSCTGAAFGQTTGADVIVGDLPGISNNGVTGLYDGFAVGTTSCNKGNTPLNWFTGGTDNRHPVIGQNLFRLRAGKFEQIGQGWLKHGFTALQGTICQAQFGFPCQATAGFRRSEQRCRQRRPQVAGQRLHGTVPVSVLRNRLRAGARAHHRSGHRG